MSEPRPLGILHASSVAWDARAVLIMGAAGRGKSSLALQLLALGADLVADDRTEIFEREATLVASAPRAIRGLIEARGIGLLHASAIDAAEAVAVVDLDCVETARLPEHRRTAIFGHDLPCLRAVDSLAFPAAIMQFLKAGRQDS